jgi:iron complex outermembrane receptor protein
MKTCAIAAVATTVCAVSQAASGDSPTPDFDIGQVPTVITPTRLRQSIQDVPASVTVITAETIRRYGITSIPEALRLVPGMAVNASTGSSYQIGYHGTNIRKHRRMNVLVDGISVYRPGFSEIFWTQLPVGLEDVDRIEVTRGPNSASYGPNSMMAVVNIITKHPGDLGSGTASVGLGTNGRYQVYSQVSRTFGATIASLGFSGEANHGYAWSSQQEADHDSTRTRRISFRAGSQLSDTSSIEIEAAYVKGFNETPFKSDFEGYPDMQVEDQYFGATWMKQFSPIHDLRLRLTHSSHDAKQEWTACFPRVTYLPELYTLWRVNPSYANAVLAGQRPRGGSAQDDLLALQAAAAVRRLGDSALIPLCGTANANRLEKRTDVELQDTYVVSSSFRVVGGLGLRNQSAESETYLGRKASNRLYRVLGNAEYKPLSGVVVNVGGYGENDDIVGWTFAPRAAINFQLSNNQSIRAAVSKGLRTPDIVEQYGNISYTLRSSTPGPDGSLSPRFYQSAVSPGDLRPEKSLSTELGYVYIDQSRGLVFDARLFRETLSNLISEPVEVADLSLSNSSSVTLYGFELQAKVEWSPTLQGFFNYAFLNNRNSTTALERSHYSRHSGALGVSKNIGDGWMLSSAYYGASGDGIGETAFGRLDVVAGRVWRLGGVRLEASLVASRFNNKSASFLAREGSFYESRFDRRTQIFVRLKAGF